MRHHIHRRRRGVFAVVACLMIGSLLLSACGRAAEGAAPNTAIPPSIATAPALGATAVVSSAPFTLEGSIEQLAQERWVVAGTPVVIDAQTTILGATRVRRLRMSEFSAAQMVGRDGTCRR